MSRCQLLQLQHRLLSRRYDDTSAQPLDSQHRVPAFRLREITPEHLTLNGISCERDALLFGVTCMLLMCIWPGMTLWLPIDLHGN